MHDYSIFSWRQSQLQDAESMAAIYNETIACGGHSPQLRNTDALEIQRLIKRHINNNWGVWTILCDQEVVAWVMVHPIEWGLGVCLHSGDISVYVKKEWYSRGPAVLAALIVYKNCRKLGFELLSCWIMGSNHRSIQISRSFRMKLWGILPRVARYGERFEDVQIWGWQYDDADSCDYMDRLLLRISRRYPNINL